MTEPRPDPFLIADDRALDFLNSIASPWGREIEWIGDGRDLIAWLEQAGMLPAAAATSVRAQAGPRALDTVASEARDLREWFRRFVQKHSGRPLRRSTLGELVRVNELLEGDDAYRQIEGAPTGENGAQALSWGMHRRWRSPKALLLPIAEAIGDLVSQKDFTYVRRCEGAGCTLWFLDVSKGHGRRWCSMALCGNRAKAAAHRERARLRAG